MKGIAFFISHPFTNSVFLTFTSCLYFHNAIKSSISFSSKVFFFTFQRFLVNFTSFFPLVTAFRQVLRGLDPGCGRAARVPRANVGHLPLQRGPQPAPGVRDAQARARIQGKQPSQGFITFIFCKFA